MFTNVSMTIPIVLILIVELHIAIDIAFVFKLLWPLMVKNFCWKGYYSEYNYVCYISRNKIVDM